MGTFRVISPCPEDTVAVGAALAANLEVSDVVLLDGPLGCGKTTLVRGLARALEVEGPIRSPTFNLVHEYRTVPPLAHADLYRLTSLAEVASLGLDDLMARCALVLEWPDRAPEAFPKDSLKVRFQFLTEGPRLIEFVPGGPRSRELLKGLEKSLASGSYRSERSAL